MVLHPPVELAPFSGNFYSLPNTRVSLFHDGWSAVDITIFSVPHVGREQSEHTMYRLESEGNSQSGALLKVFGSRLEIIHFGAVGVVETDRLIS